MPYTKEEITEAYEKLIWAQGLIDFVLKGGFSFPPDMAKTEGSFISIFSILDDYLKKGAEVLDDLEFGQEEKFAQLWKQEAPEEKGGTEQ
jgi:hypothetical protein